MSKRSVKTSLYVLTEGHTEQAYFARIGEILGDDKENRYALTVEVRSIQAGSKTEPKGLVEEAKKKRSDYDEIWVVFDRDRDRDRLIEQALKLAKQYKIQVAFSSIAFETWVLLHFERNQTPFYRSDCQSRGQACTCNGNICLSAYLKQEHRYPLYKKGSARLYDDLCSRLNTALDNAAWLRNRLKLPANVYLRNPYTDVDAFVCRLFQHPVITYVDVGTSFVFQSVECSVQRWQQNANVVDIVLCLVNTSPGVFVFNQHQKIALLVGNQSTPYQWAGQAVVINPKQSDSLTIRFSPPQISPQLRLRFVADYNRLVMVELYGDR